MSTLDALDSTAMPACESLLAILFAFVFLGIRRAFPEARGARAIALSFVLVLPITLFLAWRGETSPVVSVLMANSLLLASFISLYEGVAAFAGGFNQRWLLWFGAFAAFAVEYFFTEIRPGIAPCLTAVALAAALIQGCTAFLLWRRSLLSTQRAALHVFGAFTALLACFSLYRAWFAFVHGAPQALAQQEALEARMLVSGIFSLGASGLCFLVLSSRELAARRRLESQRDPLSGTYNRRGLEANLALELEHLHQGGQTGGQTAFSIALVALDDLDSIRQQEGRAAARAAIRQAAATMATHLRGSDHIGRLHGEEFLLLLSQTSLNQSLIVADRLSAAVAKLSFLDRNHPLTLSIGIAEATVDDNGPALIARAEQALGQARLDGTNCRRVAALAKRSSRTGVQVAVAS